MRPPVSELSPLVTRIGFPSRCAHLVRTAAGTIRIGTCPGMNKVVPHPAPVVWVLPRDVNSDGDAWCGEEFCLWQNLFGSRQATTYLGPADRLHALRAFLALTVPYGLDAQHRLTEPPVLEELMFLSPAAGEWRHGQVCIRETATELTVSERSRELLRLPLAVPPPVLPPVAAPLPPPSGFEVLVAGAGNGWHEETASFLLRWPGRALLVDPPAYPCRALVALGIDAGSIDGIIVTHNHEDHSGGLLPLLEHLHAGGRRPDLLTAPSVFACLQQQFPGYPLAERCRFLPLVPGNPFPWGGAAITCRRNLHCLPYDTLGLKVSVANATVGFSGDTRYAPGLAARLGRPELGHAWFSGCGLVFHEVEPDTDPTVHTRPAALAALVASLPATVYSYHCADRADLPCPRAARGMRFAVGCQGVRCC